MGDKGKGEEGVIIKIYGMAGRYRTRARRYRKRRMPRRKSRSRAITKRSQSAVPAKFRRKRHSILFKLYDNLFQKRIRTSLKYCQTVNIFSAGAREFKIFRINDIFQPYLVPPQGHQPLYRDKWATFYERYRVIACRFHIYFRPRRTEREHEALNQIGEWVADSDAYNMDQIPTIVGWEVNNDGQNLPLYFDPGDSNSIREQRVTSPKMHDYKVTTADPYKVYGFTGVVSMKDLYNDRGRAEETTNVANSPNLIANLFVCVLPFGGNQTDAYQVDVKLEYLVEFSGPTVLNPENEN